jgi:deazaflavin-dependent oxidoreductase (nitroreductase family)
MDDRIRRALRHGHVIDITTTGRRTGRARRIEIVFHNIDGRIYITGSPRADRRRAWLLNLEADPRFIFHLKGPVTADLPATARIVTDEGERRAVLAEVVKTWTTQDLERMTKHSPLVEVTFNEVPA